ERVRGIQALIPEVSVHISMKRIRTTFGDHIHETAKRAAEFRLSARSDNLEHTHDIVSIENSAEPGSIVVGGETIDHEVVREVALAIHRKSLPRYRRSFGEELVARGVCRRDSRNQQGNIQE